MDTTFTFEKIRNRPVKYNRELVSTTLRAMKRIAEIRQKRQDRFYHRRMAPHIKKDILHKRKRVQRFHDIIKEPFKLPPKAAAQVALESKLAFTPLKTSAETSSGSSAMEI